MAEDLLKEKLQPASTSVVPLRPTQRKILSPVTRGDIGIVPRLVETPDKVLTSRYEMKYFIHESQARAVEGFVRNLLPVDHYSKNGDYLISTLYLDSHNLQLCKESMEGHKNRFKLRIRTYTDDPTYPCFFEIKRRMNTICLKDRARINHCDCSKLLSFESAPCSQIGDKNLAAINQFLLYAKTINAGPVLKVRYRRYAFEGDTQNRVRVTFDRGLAFKVVNKPDLSLSGSGWQTFNNNGVVLEIKFNNHYPVWLTDMVRMFNLNRQSFSKYARSVEQSCLLRYCAPRIPARIY